MAILNKGNPSRPKYKVPLPKQNVPGKKNNIEWS